MTSGVNSSTKQPRETQEFQGHKGVDVNLRARKRWRDCKALPVSLARVSAMLLGIPLQHNQNDIIAMHRQREPVKTALSDVDNAIGFREVTRQRIQLLKLGWCQLFGSAHIDVC